VGFVRHPARDLRMRSASERKLQRGPPPLAPPHPNSGLPEFGTQTGRSRINPTSAGEGNPPVVQRREAGQVLLEMSCTESHEHHLLERALRQWCLPLTPPSPC
jgi:hypothetical protein